KLEPGQILDIRAGQEQALEVAAPAQHRVVAAKRDHSTRELQQRALLLVQVPVEPAELVVLTVPVVVAVLCTRNLVTTEQHRHALREQQRGEERTHTARA